MADPEYVVIDLAELRQALIRGMGTAGSGVTPTDAVLAVLREHGTPARENRHAAATTTLNDSVTHWPAKHRFVTDWEDDPA